MAHKDLEASLSFIPKDRELQQRNAAAVFQACYELLAYTACNLKQEYEQRFTLLDAMGKVQPAKVVAKTTMEPGSGGAYLRLNFNIVWKKNERGLPTLLWSCSEHHRVYC